MELSNFVLAAVLAIIGAVSGFVGWWLKARNQELRAIEKMLREEQRKIYKEILDPYIGLFSDRNKNVDEQVKKLTSHQYKSKAFEMFFFGSDEVIKAYNKLIQHGSRINPENAEPDLTIVTDFGQLLLEVRKSLGNKKTKLNAKEMLGVIINDLSKLPA